MNNRELFKEAIADAKAVKEAAIANAKVALEEAFAPFLREKLTQKLSEMEEETYESEDEISEDEYGDSTDKDFLQNEMSYDEKAMETPVGEMNMMGDETIDELNLDELLAELELEEEMSDETDLNEAKEEEEEEEEETEEEEYKDVDADGIEDSDDTEIDITDMESLKSIIEDEIEKMIQSGELQAGPEYEAEEGEEIEMGDEMGDEMELDAEEEIDEDFSIDELLAELKKKSKKVMVKKVVKKEDETEKAKKELDEAIKVVRALKGELQEMKLFNAKLLYTNKIFKARNLNESQKVKVLSTFDKAGTIKEVELVYETLSSSFVTAKKQVVKESLGFASKSTGVSQHQQKQMIVEEDAMVKRFKKLAGLI